MLSGLGHWGGDGDRGWVGGWGGVGVGAGVLKGAAHMSCVAKRSEGLNMTVLACSRLRFRSSGTWFDDMYVGKRPGELNEWQSLWLMVVIAVAVAVAVACGGGGGGVGVVRGVAAWRGGARGAAARVALEAAGVLNALVRLSPPVSAVLSHDRLKLITTAEGCLAFTCIASVVYQADSTARPEPVDPAGRGEVAAGGHAEQM